MASYLYWLIDKDPYNGVLQSLYNWVVFHPLYTANTQGELVTAQLSSPVYLFTLGELSFPELRFP